MWDVISRKLLERILFLLGPLPPVDVAVTNVTETSFLLSWKHTESFWDRYLIRISSSESSDNRVLSTNDKNILVEGLTAGDFYAVQVESVYENVGSFPVPIAITMCKLE